MTKSAASTFVYVTYIRTTPEKLWAALTDSDFMPQYWFNTHCESDWKPGSSWKMISADGTLTDSGEIIEAVPSKFLSIKWRNEFRPELAADGYSLCTMEIEPVAGAVKLTVTHTNDVPNSKFIGAVSGGWPRILSNLKSLLETGQVLMVEKG
ncbi:MAG: SRPBCC family protein [Parvibaculaceae bacterium]